MQLIPFEPDHLAQLTLQAAQAKIQTYLTPEYGRMLQGDNAWTLIVPPSTIIACIGLVPEDTDRAFAWALLSPGAGAHLSSIHKKIQRFLKLCPYTRMETVVESDFKPGHRWMELLGFEREGTLKHFYRAGEHVDLYARYHLL